MLAEKLEEVCEYSRIYIFYGMVLKSLMSFDEKSKEMVQIEPIKKLIRINYSENIIEMHIQMRCAFISCIQNS